MDNAGREWMVGHQGHPGLLTLEEVGELIRTGQLQALEMVKRQGQPWRVANDVPELRAYFGDSSPSWDQESTMVFPQARPAPAPTDPPKVPVAQPPPPPAPKPEPKPSPPVEPAKAPLPVQRPPTPPPPPAPAITKKAEVPPKAAAARPPLSYRSYSNEELVRAVAHAFDWRSLLLGFAVMLPIFFVGACIGEAALQWIDAGTPRDIISFIAAAGSAVGFLCAIALLAARVRGLLEDARSTLLGSLSDGMRIAAGLLAMAAGLAILYGILLLVLRVVVAIRDAHWFLAAALRFLQFIPLLVTGLMTAVLGWGSALTLYLAGVMSVERCGPVDGLKHFWGVLRAYGRRWILHIVGISTSTLVVGAGCWWLVNEAYRILEASNPGNQEIATQWKGYWVVGAFYDHALQLALIGIVPLSVAATLAVLSYGALRPRPTAAPPEELQEADLPGGSS